MDPRKGCVLEFTWDEEKRASVLAERGVDLVRAGRIFEGWVLTKPDLRKDYGEERFISIGKVGDDYLVLVHT